MFSELAILGGVPAFAQPKHVGRPNIGDRDRLHARIDEMLDRQWLTNQGPLVAQLEQRVAQDLHVEHCVAVCNATSGLQVLAKALDLSGEVIVPGFTFVATAHALRWIGLQPVFCDVDPVTHTLDPTQAAALITPRTSALLGTHLWGHACDVDALQDLADEQGLHMIYDASHAVGCQTRGRAIGGFGDGEVFSLHATKFVNAFEGGFITTDDDALADQLRLGRNFGFADVDRVVTLGINAKMSEASAAMALTSFDAMGEILARNRANQDAYAAGLSSISGLTHVTTDPADQSNEQYVVIEVDTDTCGISRDGLMVVLHAENILARRYFHPGCHRMEPYASESPDLGARLPVTESLSSRVLVLPTGLAVTPREVDVICDVIQRVVANAARLCDPTGSLIEAAS